MNRPLKSALVLLTLAVIAAGCSRDNPTAPAPAPSTNPGTSLTPETQSGLVTMQSALESPAWQSLDALRLTSSPAASAAGSVRPMLKSAVATQSAVTIATSSLVRDVAERLRQQAATSPEAKVIPASVLGTTYVFDPLQHSYVADPSRTGAPANGVRYILYAVNPFTHEPVVSAEVGDPHQYHKGKKNPKNPARQQGAR